MVLLQEAYSSRNPLALCLLRGSGVVRGLDEDLWAAGLTLEVTHEAVARDHSCGAATSGLGGVVGVVVLQLKPSYIGNRPSLSLSQGTGVVGGRLGGDPDRLITSAHLLVPRWPSPGVVKEGIVAPAVETAVVLAGRVGEEKNDRGPVRRDDAARSFV